MKILRYFGVFALAGGLLLADDVNLTNLGPWPVCSSGASAYMSLVCNEYQPGREMYLLMIHGTNPRAVAYRYTITGTLVSTGQAVTVSAIVERADNSAGVTSAAVTLGGIISNIDIVVSDLSEGAEVAAHHKQLI